MSKLLFFLTKEAQNQGGYFKVPNDGDAGFDLVAIDTIKIKFLETVCVPTGLYIQIPKGYVGFIKDRSSMAIKGIRTSAGVIDESYRGEIKVVITNLNNDDFEIVAGAKIAQIVFLPYMKINNIDFLQVNSLDLLDETSRGNLGFGSTGS